MADYKITCCSTVDISAERLKELDISYAKCNYFIGDEMFEDDLYQSITPEEYYGKIENGALPTTKPVTAEQLCELFEPILKAGFDLIHIELSSGLSTCWKSAQEALIEMKEKYPERKIFVVDSLAASSGYGMLVEMAADYKSRGMGIEELRRWLEESKLHIRHWFCSQNLMHFKRGGRISAATAVMGTMFKVCPLLDVNDMGKLIFRERHIGNKRTIKAMLARMREEAQDGIFYYDKCYICHSQRAEDAETLKKLVEGEFFKLRGKVEVHPIGPVIGAHSGPGTLAVFFFSQTKRTR